LNLGDKIRSMSELLTSEEIAKAIEIPEELVKGVLSGDIPDSVLDEYDPEKPPEIRIVEQRKFVRSLIVGIVSLGSSGGSTLTSSLATLASLRTTTPVAAVDLNEFSMLGSCLGIPFEKGKLYPNLMAYYPQSEIAFISHITGFVVGAGMGVLTWGDAI